VYGFFTLACLITWACDFPMALALATHTTPPAYALPLAGLGALGPMLAALIIATPRHELREVFGHWRTSPLWIAVALFVPAALHLPATLIEVALGGRPAQWFYPPVRAEHVAALVFFSVGEEFGWRGFAYPRLAERFGKIAGSLMLGTVWAVWHLGMLFTPEHGAPALATLGQYVLELSLWSVVIAWFFERGRRSMAVAIALHAGGHLDNVFRAPESEVRLRVLRFAVLLVAAAFAARGLRAKPERERG